MPLRGYTGELHNIHTAQCVTLIAPYYSSLPGLIGFQPSAYCYGMMEKYFIISSRLTDTGLESHPLFGAAQ